MSCHVCKWYHAYAFDNPLRKIFHNPIEILEEQVKRGMKVLDIGCGMGYFSIAMAKMLGDEGKVFSIDLQEKMLEVLMKRAKKAGVADRISTVKCSQNSIEFTEKVDFAMIFWMAHEVPDKDRLFAEISNCLNNNGKLLIAEPKMHVSTDLFRKILNTAEESGFTLCNYVKIKLSRAAVLQKS